MDFSKKVLTIGIFLAFSISWALPFAYGQQITYPQEVAALQAVRRRLIDSNRRLNWTRLDPCTSNWTGVICTFDQTDGYLHVQELRLLRLNLYGTLAPELGLLTYMKRLDFLWNHISGSIPKEIGQITSLELLLLSGNNITGSLPDELGFLPNLTKFQLDLNSISGQIPATFSNLRSVQHFHMNNNQFSGQIPPGISTLSSLKHVLLDNNHLSGYLPPELAQMPSLTILQLDNNNFAGTGIPDSYRTFPKLLKLSLRNCSLEGTIPDLSGLRRLLYLDLSMNSLTGPITTNSLAANITTIILSNNQLNGSIPSNFSGLPRLQKLHLDHNSLSGSVPTTIWSNITFTSDTNLEINFENNLLSDVSGILNIPANVTFSLRGNPVCTNTNQQSLTLVCGTDNGNGLPPSYLNQPVITCQPQACPSDNYYRYVPTLSADTCFCAAPFGIGIRLRSPSISDFPLYRNEFDTFVSSNLYVQPNVHLDLNQVYVDSIQWEVGPRLNMFVLIFPAYAQNGSSSQFDAEEVHVIASAFASFSLPGSDIFGPYDLLNFTAEGPYRDMILPPITSSSHRSKGAVAGIAVGVLLGVAFVLAGVVFFLYKKRKTQKFEAVSVKNPSLPKITLKMDGVMAFTFEDLQTATNRFSIHTQIGQGGYGIVYKGTLANGVIVAIKRAQQGSLQGNKEFYTEIEMLSRLHHRNLVSLVGYCDEEDEQMLVYEYMPNGSLHDLLSAKYTAPLSFSTRLNIALGSSRGILYLHTEADPPIIHRDIKANNILLDSKFTPKVSDFGISRLAPVSDTRGDTMTHISTTVKGTPGYVDPEYFKTHQLTEKSDVYSLGIVFLELLTGMQPIYMGRNIVREVNTACQSGIMFSIIDKGMGPYPSDCVKKFMELALRCASDETTNRPLMLEVVRELENISGVLPKSENSAANMNLSSSGTPASSPASSSIYDRRSSYMNITTDLTGGDLVSGVIHNIRPR